jgi:hypothetical protein
MKTLLEYLYDLMARKFYGEIVVKFREGKIIHIEKKESLDVAKFN